MSVPTLIYFNGRGRAELVRYLFVLAGAKFNDVRVEFPEFSKPEYKATLPFGQLPVLDTEHGRIAQSVAIARYVASQNNLYGSNDFEKAQVDSWVDSVQDLLTPFKTAKDDEAKAKFHAETAPKFLSIYENHLKKSGGQYFVGNKYSFADVAIFFGLENLIRFNDLPDFIKNYPTITGFFNKFESVPSIAEHIKARPTTKF
eukprot:gene18230-21811_t